MNHPGTILKEYLEVNDITIAECARQADLPRPHVSRVVNGKQKISAMIAIGLGKCTDRDAWDWGVEQLEYDLWVEEQRGRKQSRYR